MKFLNYGIKTVFTRIFRKMAFSLGGRGSELGILVFFLSLGRRFPSPNQLNENFEIFQEFFVRYNRGEDQISFRSKGEMKWKMKYLKFAGF